MKVILLAGHTTATTKALEVKNGVLRIDTQVDRLEAMKYEVIIVAAGDAAENLLRLSRTIERCELVFDTHGEEASLLTNLRAGLFATEEAVFVLPANVDIPDQICFQAMINAYFKAGLRTENHGFWFNDYPLLVTRNGNAFFRKASDLKDFSNPGLQLTVLEDANLATRVNTL